LHSLIFVKISIFLKIFPKIPHFHKNLARLGLVPMPLIGIFSPAIFDVSASGGVIGFGLAPLLATGADKRGFDILWSDT
jgi:hypothetical protein